MDSKQRFYCKNCNYGMDFPGNSGMRYSERALLSGGDYRGTNDPLLYELISSQKMKNEVSYLIKNGATLGKYHDAMYACPHCSHLSNHFFFQLESVTVYEPSYKCDHCRTPLKMVKARPTGEHKEVKLVDTANEVMDWCCPDCSNNILCANHT